MVGGRSRPKVNGELSPMLAVGFEGTTIPPDVVELATEGGLGGVVLFARNCPTVEAVFALTEAARALDPDVLVLVDHEGGRVHRLPAPFTRFPPAAVVGRAGDPALAGAVARAMARELRAAGFDSGLAPVLDCLTDTASTVIGDRAFGRDPDLVAACGEAFVRSALAEGLIPVAKHFPGHGRTAVDSHRALPEVDASMATIEAVELAPFVRALRAGCPAVLVAHVRYRQLDPEWPASLSPATIGGLLRKRLGFAGLILSDDLEMEAVAGRWGVAAAAARFLEAGGDLALVCRDAAARAGAAAATRGLVQEGRLARDHGRACRAALRASVVAASPRPEPSVIGAPEHRALAEEVAHRGADRTTSR
jgi:beta-N-acetylhexosaminidase